MAEDEDICYDLHIAVAKGSVNNVRRLLEEGADPNLLSSKATSPVHFLYGHFPGAVFNQMLELFIQHNADFKQAYKNDDYPYRPPKTILDMCIQRLTFESEASLERAMEQIKPLLDAGSIPLVHPMYIISMFGYPMTEELVMKVKFLSKYKDELQLDWSEKEEYDDDIKGGTILHKLSTYQFEDIRLAELTVEACVSAGIDINTKDDNGKTPLNIAIAKEQTKMISALISCGADASIVDAFDRSLLHLATYNGDMELVKALMSQNIDKNAQDTFQRSALHIACYFHSSGLELIQILVEHGIDVNLKDKFGLTALDLIKHHISRINWGFSSSTPYELKYNPSNTSTPVLEYLSQHQNIDTSTPVQPIPNTETIINTLKEKFPIFHNIVDAPSAKVTQGQMGRPEEFLKDLLSTPGLSPMCSVDVTTKVKTHVTTLMQRLTDELRALVPVLDTESLMVDSGVDGTCTDFPNHFTFLFQLKNSGCFQMKRSTRYWAEDGEIMVRFANEEVPEKWEKYCYTRDSNMDSAKLNDCFNVEVRKVLEMERVWQGLDLCCDYLFPYDHIKTAYVYPDCGPLVAFWFGPECPGMCITIDVQLAIPFDNWPEGGISPLARLLSDEKKKTGCFAVLEGENRQFTLSSCILDTFIVKNIPETGRIALVVCKILMDVIKYVSEKKSMLKDLSSSDLKTALFYLMEEHLEGQHLPDEGISHTPLNLEDLTDEHLKEIAYFAVKILQRCENNFTTEAWDAYPYLLNSNIGPKIVESNTFSEMAGRGEHSKIQVLILRRLESLLQ